MTVAPRSSPALDMKGGGPVLSIRLEDRTSVAGHKLYPAYKESGVDALGRIPTHWDTTRLRRVFAVVSGSTPESGIAEYWEGDIPWVTPEDLGELNGSEILHTRRRITEAGYQSCATTLVPGGSLVLSTRAPIGHLGIAGASLCTNQGCRCLVFRRDSSRRFFYYQLMALRHDLESFGQGSTFKELRTDKLQAVLLVEPPKVEQHAIAAFLDRETGKIDELVAKKKRLVDLLHEKRAGLISWAVTKGLDQKAPMRDSGVAWLGDIPAHWTVGAARRFIRSIEQGWSPVADDREAGPEEWAVIKLSAVNRGTFRPEEHKALPAGLAPDTRYEIREGDFLLTRANTPELVGDVCVTGAVRSRLMLCDLVYRLGLRAECVAPRYLAYWFLSRTGRHQIQVDARGSSRSMVKVSQTLIRAWVMALPHLAEQRSIAAFLDRETAKIDALVGEVRGAIDRLRELRIALISAVVTGKIDVREETTA